MNSARPPGGHWKNRLIVGHNVSFDRSYIKEQYLIKVSLAVFHLAPFLVIYQRPFWHKSSFFFYFFIILNVWVTWFNFMDRFLQVFYKKVFFLKGSKVRFMDTMSLHMAISGLTGFQRTLWMANKMGKRTGLHEVKEHIKKAGQKKKGPMVCVFFSPYFSYHLHYILYYCRSAFIKRVREISCLSFGIEQFSVTWCFLVYRLALGTGWILVASTTWLMSMLCMWEDHHCRKRLERPL